MNILYIVACADVVIVAAYMYYLVFIVYRYEATDKDGEE